ncbi:MAG TPA: ATP-grasp domain-containing protein [Pirellulaceae bacterium]|nr:ATP-grasp domain-containing protein [Pirellulaceae bacterium]HMO92157.1 ATP-grasp domain-containing protein [Pirellulaceae bacterium]HMP68917.1 ATP-grasp domain-containing protein [Pirellulaceae bacterium]
MRTVIFVAPYFMDATEKFIAAAASLPDVRLGLVSCDPLSKLRPEIQARLSGHYAVPGIEAHQLLHGIEMLGRQFGSVDRIIGMLEQIQVTLGKIRDHLGIRGMGEHVARNFRDKPQMKDVLRAANVPCARHCLTTDLEKGMRFAEQVGFPLVIKPPAGAGAKGTFRCENPAQLDECLRAVLPSEQNPILIEEFITGKEHSFDSVCLNGQIVWSSISDYSPGPLEVVREPWIQWCVVIPRETDRNIYHRILPIAQQALSALGMQDGLTHLEWFERADGSIAVSEVGARPPGAQFTTLISYAHDFNLYRAWSEVMIFERFQPVERKYAAGAAYLRGMGKGKVVGVSGLDEIAREYGEIVVEAKVPDQGQPASAGYEGEGYIIVRHPNTDVVKQALQSIISRVRVHLSDN